MTTILAQAATYCSGLFTFGGPSSPSNQQHGQQEYEGEQKEKEEEDDDDFMSSLLFANVDDESAHAALFCTRSVAHSMAAYLCMHESLDRRLLLLCSCCWTFDFVTRITCVPGRVDEATLCQTLCRLRGLKELDCSDCINYPEALLPLAASSNFPILHTVKFSNCSIDSFVVSEIMTNWSALQNLDVSESEAVDDGTLIAISESGFKSSLKILSLSGCENFTNAGLASLDKLDHLLSLDISGCSQLFHGSTKYHKVNPNMINFYQNANYCIFPQPRSNENGKWFVEAIPKRLGHLVMSRIDGFDFSTYLKDLALKLDYLYEIDLVQTNVDMDGLMILDEFASQFLRRVIVRPVEITPWVMHIADQAITATRIDEKKWNGFEIIKKCVNKK